MATLTCAIVADRGTSKFQHQDSKKHAITKHLPIGSWSPGASSGDKCLGFGAFKSLPRVSKNVYDVVTFDVITPRRHLVLNSHAGIKRWLQVVHGVSGRSALSSGKPVKRKRAAAHGRRPEFNYPVLWLAAEQVELSAVSCGVGHGEREVRACGCICAYRRPLALGQE